MVVVELLSHAGGEDDPWMFSSLWDRRVKVGELTLTFGTASGLIYIIYEQIQYSHVVCMILIGGEKMCIYGYILERLNMESMWLTRSSGPIITMDNKQ